MAVDDYIPFVEYFIVPYLLWFVYVTYAVLHFLFNNKIEFYKLCTFLFTGMTVFLIVSTIYPNGQHLRPYIFLHNNVCTDLVKWLYATDTPTNLFPSIHVYNALGVHFAIVNSESFRNNKRVRIGSFILMASIIMSTMFLKQHSVFDVITAFVMATVMYSFVYGKSLQFSRQKAYDNQVHQI
jgi:membrane-associated phospholipid phosphatase